MFFPPGLLPLARQLRILAPRSATDEELQLVHSKAQVAGLKRAQAAAESGDGLVWLPVKGCLETWENQWKPDGYPQVRWMVFVRENLEMDEYG